jgi:hypothetical protein
MGGNDPAHELPKEEKDRLGRELRAEADGDRRAGKPRDATRKLARATNISRVASRKAQHH